MFSIDWTICRDCDREAYCDCGRCERHCDCERILTAAAGVTFAAVAETDHGR
jgi:hypothetical protein